MTKSVKLRANSSSLRLDRQRSHAITRPLPATPIARKPPVNASALDAQIAQLVEHATENRSVAGSIPALGTIFQTEVFVVVGMCLRAQAALQAATCFLLHNLVPTSRVRRIVRQNYRTFGRSKTRTGFQSPQPVCCRRLSPRQMRAPPNRHAGTGMHRLLP
jgi:hypothetical protein